MRKQNQFVELKLIVSLKISSFIIEMLNMHSSRKGGMVGC